jgi:small subunit ribosomal protein S1
MFTDPHPFNWNDHNLTEMPEITEQLSAAAMAQLWEEITEIFNTDQVVTLQVMSYNRGGLLVDYKGIRGFVPISHILDLHPTRSLEKQLAERVGESYELKVIECVPEISRLIFSQRSAQAGAGTRKQIYAKIAHGVVVQGTVSTITSFGVFIDLGGVEGLVHISEVSWGRVHNLHQIFNIGQKLRVLVINIDPKDQKISLSIKKLSPNPWNDMEKRYQVGNRVDGLVTSISHYGIFVKLEEGLEGLIHASELENANFVYPSNLVSVGQRVLIQVLKLSPEKQRLSLRLIRVFNEDSKAY